MPSKIIFDDRKQEDLSSWVLFFSAGGLQDAANIGDGAMKCHMFIYKLKHPDSVWQTLGNNPSGDKILPFFQL